MKIKQLFLLIIIFSGMGGVKGQTVDTTMFTINTSELTILNEDTVLRISHDSVYTFESDTMSTVVMLVNMLKRYSGIINDLQNEVWNEKTLREFIVKDRDKYYQLKPKYQRKLKHNPLPAQKK